MPLATETEAMYEYAHNAGFDDPERAWILTPQDVWMRNPFYDGPSVPHPEEDDYIDYEAVERENDEIEINGPKFCLWLARKNAGDPFYDEIPF